MRDDFPTINLFFPKQCLTRSDALEACTLSTARAAFEEDIKGSLTAGKLADITVLSDDIISMPEDRMLQTRVMLTIVGGQVVHRAGKEYEDGLVQEHGC
jgi:predicted amidohydrolase YtcJ